MPFPVMLDTGLAWVDPAAVSRRGSRRGGSLAVQSEPTAGGVRFRFGVSTAAVSAPPLFQTRLAGVDADWTPPAPQTTRDLPRLPPGRHRFEVRLVAGETDRDFPVATTDLDIPFPWWQQPPVLSGLALGLIAVAAGTGREFARRRARRRIAGLEEQQAMDRERARIARDIHDSLGAGLTRLAILSEVIRRDGGDGGLNGERLDAIYTGARELTRSVDEIVWAVNPGNDTLAHLVNYIAHDVQDAARSAGLAVRVRVPGDLPADVTVATQLRHHLCLAVRELVANVLKHASARELRLEIDATPDRILVTLADDGRGFDPGQPVVAGQDGLANVAGRLRELGGCLDLESTTGQGTRARLSVPLGSGAPATAFNGVPHAV
jgi:signal transduction histidine kinase